MSKKIKYYFTCPHCKSNLQVTAEANRVGIQKSTCSVCGEIVKWKPSDKEYVNPQLKNDIAKWPKNIATYGLSLSFILIIGYALPNFQHMVGWIADVDRYFGNNMTYLMLIIASLCAFSFAYDFISNKLLVSNDGVIQSKWTKIVEPIFNISIITSLLFLIVIGLKQRAYLAPVNNFIITYGILLGLLSITVFLVYLSLAYYKKELKRFRLTRWASATLAFGVFLIITNSVMVNSSFSHPADKRIKAKSAYQEALKLKESKQVNKQEVENKLRKAAILSSQGGDIETLEKAVNSFLEEN